MLVSTFRLPALFIYLSSGSIVVCIRGAALSTGGFVPTPYSGWHQLKQFAIGVEVAALSTTIGPYPVLFF